MAFPQATDYRPPIIPDGEIYDNPENGKSYYWTQILLPEGSTPDTADTIGGYWSVVCDGESNKFLLRYGDFVDDAPNDPVQYIWTSAIWQQSGVAPDFYSYFLQHSGGFIFSAPGPTEFRNEGTFSVDAPRIDLEAGTGGIGATSEAWIDIRARGALAGAGDVTIASTYGSEVIPRIIDDTDDIKQITNKEYVDAKDELLRQDIIELEEEIDAIAPSLEYGTWKFEQPAGGTIRPPVSGTFYLLNNGAYTDKYEETTSILVHNDEFVATNDNDPVDNHTWADADIGELIQLFDAADPDFFLGKITGKTVESDHVIFTVDRIQSSGVPNDNTDPVTGEYLTRINIFKEPSGGDVSGFVLKTGDTMTGNLTIDKSDESTDTESALALTGSRSSTQNAAATIKFENKQASNAIGYLTYRSYGGTSFFKFNQNLDLGTKGLSGVDHIELRNGGYIGSGDKPRIRVRNGASGNNGAGTDIQRPGDGLRTFAIKGKKPGSTNVEDIFWSYGNTGNTGDAINYTGLITSGNHIATKGYVDSKGGVDISCTTSGRSKGDMWYCSDDSALYIKVS